MNIAVFLSMNCSLFNVTKCQYINIHMWVLVCVLVGVYVYECNICQRVASRRSAELIGGIQYSGNIGPDRNPPPLVCCNYSK